MKPKALLYVLLLMGLGLVYFGLRPKGYRPLNQAMSIDGGSGLAMGRQGIAFTQTPESGAVNPLSAGGITLNFFFESGLSSSRYLTFLASLWSDSDDVFVSLCQWRDQILVLRHHKHSAKEAPKLGFRFGSKTRQMLTITSDCSGGTRIYLNGEVVDSSQTLKLTCGKPPPERITLGNSPKGNGGWRGKIWAFSLLERSLTESEVATLKDSLAISTSTLPLFQAPAYFGELKIPKWMKGPYREFLISPADNSFHPMAYATDMVLNFLAFIPWGFLWVLFLSRRGFAHLSSLSGAFAAAVFLSFLFEAVQYFIPTRTAQLIDLLLNGVGGLLGGGLALVWVSFHNKKRLYKPPSR